MSKMIRALFFLLSFIALTWLCMEFLPLEMNFNFYFRHYTYNYEILRYIIQYTPYLGIITSIIFLYSTKGEKKYIILLMLSLFDLLYAYRPNIMMYINERSNTNIAVHPQNPETPLYRFIEQNDTSNVIRLLENGANPNEKIENFAPHLIQVIEKNNYESTKALIKHGAYINELFDGMSALHIAVQNSNQQIVSLLLEHGADVNAHISHLHGKYWVISPNGRSPLFYAVEDDNLEVAKLLLNSGATIDIKDDYSVTVFDIAKSNEMKKLLNTSSSKK